MIENFVDIQTKDGICDTFTVRPDENGPFPAIIIYIWMRRLLEKN